MRHRTWLWAMLPAVLLLAGCLRVEVAVEVNDDGSGTFSMLAAMDQEVLAELGETDANPFDPEVIESGELPPGASVEAYEQDGFRGSRITVPFEAGDDVGAAINEVMSASGGGALAGEEGLFERFNLVRDEDGDGWDFDAAVVLQEAAEDEELQGDLGGDLLEDASLTVRLSLPGEVVEHNADEVRDDGTLVWQLDLAATGEQVMQAQSEPGGADPGIPGLVIIVVGSVVLIGAAAFVLWRRSTRAREA